MKKGEIRDVAEQGDVQLNLLDEQDLMEVESDLYPGEQIVLCRNPLRAQAGKEQREALWKKAEKRFEKMVQNIKNRRLKDPTRIGIRVGKILYQYTVGPYFTLDIREGHFSYAQNEAVTPKRQHLTGCMPFEPA